VAVAGMANIYNILAKNLTTYREQKKLSPDRVAKITGVSKTLLGQI
jgi:transcriptional regulator with XRE-family HTH domain